MPRDGDVRRAPLHHRFSITLPAGIIPGGCLKRVITALVLAGVWAGCRSEPEQVTITREQFVDVIVQLRQADAATDDPAEFEASKATILGDAGITDSMLIAYSRVHGSDIAFMAEVWDTIARRLVREDTIPR